jgi:hypothetical protein
LHLRSVALALVVAFAGGGLHAAESQPFSGNFRVQLVDDSIWAHCEVDIARWENQKVEQVSECRVEDAKPRKAKRSLAPNEVQVLTGLLRDSRLRLFEGQWSIVGRLS